MATLAVELHDAGQCLYRMAVEWYNQVTLSNRNRTMLRTPRFLSGLLRSGRQLMYEVVDSVCPAACAVCSRDVSDGKDVLCGECWQQLHESLQGEACPVCGHDTGPYSLIQGRCLRCQKRRPRVQRIVRVGKYDGVLRQLILNFKFHNQSHLDEFLGSLLAAAIIGDAELRTADCMVPVPLHWRRRLVRKYNQANLLAQSAARQLRRQSTDIPVNKYLLRIRHTEPQTSLAQSHRLTNLHGAFATGNKAYCQGKHICLIDDVTTTGTTLRVAATTLKRAGAAKVSAAVLAVAAND